MEIIMWMLGILGTGILTGIGFILKSLMTQGQALSLLVARVGTLDVGRFEQRLLDVETDMARVWGIYDAYKVAAAPSMAENVESRLAGRY